MLSDAWVIVLLCMGLVATGGVVWVIVTIRRSVSHSPLAPRISLSQLLKLKQLASRTDPASSSIGGYLKYHKEHMIEDALKDAEEGSIEEVLQIIDWFPELVDEVSRLKGIDPEILK